MDLIEDKNAIKRFLAIFSGSSSSLTLLIGRRQAEGGVEARMSMAWVSGCRWQMWPKALTRSLQIVVVRCDCPVRVRIVA